MMDFLGQTWVMGLMALLLIGLLIMFFKMRNAKDDEGDE
jgi:hypothetical protein